MKSEQANPFAVQTPEDIPAADVISLFVDVFGDFHNIPNVGHTFLNGPRGSGKSMMFRYLEPDCQQLVLDRPLKELPFFGVYVPIKNTEIKLTEFKRLANRHAEVVLSEHFLVTYVAVKFFGSLQKVRIDDGDAKHFEALRTYYQGKFSERLAWSGWSEGLPVLEKDATLPTLLCALRDLFARFYSIVTAYLRRLAFVDTPQPYAGPLLGYLDFMLPVIRDIRSLGFMPTGPVFLLVDDADNLNIVQTRILNGWVSTRTSDNVSLKISTQLSYKTYLTATSQTISSPHDFNEVNISAVYTSARDKYMSRVEQIVSRRLQKYGLQASARSFFPEYERQELAVKKLGEEIRQNWHVDGRGYRASDDVTRYARPDYIKGLQGSSKSGSTYRYAGFEQLVHISSGIVRYFLESASSMFGEMRAKTDGGEVNAIDPIIQDQVVREQAREFFFGEFDKLELDEADAEGGLDRVKKLRNLIQALGGMFHTILVSNAAERRVFSVALTDESDDEVLSVFKLGVQYGYFHESSIGNKEGTGRTRLFILSRRLAPLFTLDPTSFAGYKFATCGALRNAMERPQRFIRQLENDGIDKVLSPPQIELFEPLET
jgi:hypothetical protein